MRDPLERLAGDGTIRTGANRVRIDDRYRPVLDALVRLTRSLDANEDGDVAVYVYGSVATGQARPPGSDVDTLAIGLLPARCERIAALLSTEFVDLCRGIEIAAATAADFDGASDEAYGGRVFLHHYCVHLSGPDLDRATRRFRGDARAARGFNGDIAQHARRWRREVGISLPQELGRRVARKTLLAVAGLVSVTDTTWTTDRDHAARRWAQLHSDLAPELETLSRWTNAATAVTDDDVRHVLDACVQPITTQFAEAIGLWSDT